jgi:hypothetical protein
MSDKVDLAEQINAVGVIREPGNRRPHQRLATRRWPWSGFNAHSSGTCMTTPTSFSSCCMASSRSRLVIATSSSARARCSLFPAESSTAQRADREAQVLLIEPRGAVNTGDAGGVLTAAELEIEGAPAVGRTNRRKTRNYQPQRRFR